MKHFLLSILLLLAASPGWARPSLIVNQATSTNSTKSLRFFVGDTEDSPPVGVSGFCSVRYQQAGGDDVSLYAITNSTDAATSGTLIGSFTASTTTATTFTAGTFWVKAVATDATAGGSVMQIDCAPLTGGGGTGAAFDSCRGGGTKGGGYDAEDGRWAWTCGNYNWHGWREPAQASASYDVTCTGDGTPHTSCIHAGEVRHIGYGLHRIALAAQYTKDGGRVYLPEGLYVDNGAADMADGTTNSSFPEPYDPIWEARSDFASLGYPTELRVIQLSRGVRLVGEGVPMADTVDISDSNVSTNRPKLRGTWIVDDRGTADQDPGAGNTLGGVNGTTEPPTYYRMLVGGNPYTSYCHTTSDTDPTCDKSSTTDSIEDATDAPNLANVWGVAFETLANIDATVANICVPDSTSSIGTSQTDATGTCSLNRQIRCWDDDDTDEPRSTGGCNFGVGGNFGACQAPFEALEADYTTNSQDLQLAMHLTECPDNATSSADCGTPLGSDLYIADIRAAPGAAIAGASCATNNGTIVPLGVAQHTGSIDFNSGMPFPNFYIGGTSAFNRIFPIKRGSMDGRGAGFENIGRMPANWLSRNSATAAADCLSGGTHSNADDETACDTDTLSGFAMSYNNLIGPNNLYFKVSQAFGNKSGVVETFPAGGPNDFIGNTIDTTYRHVPVDWGDGTFGYNKMRNLNSGGTSYGFSACFGGDCRYIGNEVTNSTITYFVLAQTAAQSVHIKDTIYRNVSNSDAFHIIRGAKNYNVENEQVYGSWYQYYALINPGGEHIQKPTVTFRDNTIFSTLFPLASNATTGGGNVGAYFLFEADDTADLRADDWKSVLIDNTHIVSDTAEPCFAWFEDDFRGSSGASADTAALAREAASRVTIQNSSITGTSAKIACTGRYEYTASAFDASDSDSWAFELYAPSLINNKVNNAPIPDMLPTISEVGLDADDLPDGTRIRIHDGSATACAHTNGDLTSGSAIASCVSDPGTSGSATDGTWTAF